MDILINNPISHMYGPYFLVFYGVVIILTVMGCNFILKGNGFNSASIEIPSKPDLYEIAYLRDGEKAVSKLVCFELLQKGFLQVKNSKIERTTSLYKDSELNSLEKTVFKWVDKPRTASDLNYSSTLKSAIAEQCQTYKQSLEASGYLNSEPNSYLVGGVSAFIILSLGSYKLVSALSRGHHNVLFLIAMAIAATIWLGYTSCPLYSRLRAKGKLYLDNLKQTFSGLQGNLQTPPTQPDYNSSLLLALFGFERFKISNSSIYQDFANLFIPPSNSTSSSSKTNRSNRTSSSKTQHSNQTSSSSSCSSSFSCGTSSCGSSSSGGSSCGSSCGGGCGGCGGGCGG